MDLEIDSERWMTELQFLSGLVLLIIGGIVGWVLGRRTHRGKGLPGERARRSKHYIMGLNYLITGQTDLAIHELTQVTATDTGAVETYVILGNLYREKGALERAIRIHQSLLHRRTLTEAERTHTLFCLAQDFEKAGFMERATQVFEKVISRDRENIHAYLNLKNLYERERDWKRAFSSQQRLIDLDRSESYKSLAFLKTEMGKEKMKEGDFQAAVKHSEEAIKLYEKTAPAYIQLGDSHFHLEGYDEARQAWERLVEVLPEQAYLVLHRLAKIYRYFETEEKIESLCENLIAVNGNDWRTHLFLAERYHRGRDDEKADSFLEETLRINPRSLSVQLAFLRSIQKELKSQRLRMFVDTLESERLFIDPYVCVKCGYRTTDVLWRCPHCHSWNSLRDDSYAS